MNRTISVTGKSKFSVTPDLIVIKINTTTHSYNYEKALILADGSSAEIHNLMKDQGFNKKDLKTTSFNVATEYENVRNDKGDYVREFRGYRVKQDYSLSFDLDMPKLGKLLTGLSKLKATPKFDIIFSVRDQQTVKDKALQQASAMAHKNAKILAEASGVTLNEIVSINYSWIDIHFGSETNFDAPRGVMLEASAMLEDIVPEDIDVSDTVTITWSII